MPDLAATIERSVMRVLVVTNLFPSQTDPTYGTFVHEQAEALRAHPAVECCDVMFIDGRSDRRNYLRAVPRLRRALRHADYDVIHAHTGLAGAVAVTQRKVPVVVTYHGSELGHIRWQLWVSRVAARFAADNICVSRPGGRRLWARTHHLWCGIDLEAFAPRDRRVAREELDIAPGALAVLFPSSPKIEVKGHPAFRAVTHELGRRGHTVRELVLVDIARDRVPTVMAAADVMVLTSVSEGAPLVVMEAMASGLPIVSTPVGDVSTMVQGVKAARVLPFRADRFADAVEAISDNGTSRREPMSQSTRFDQERIVASLVRILQSPRPTIPLVTC